MAIKKEKVLEVKHYTDNLMHFKTTRDPGTRFRDGEFLMIGLDNWSEKLQKNKPIMRAYSIASPNYEEYMEFLSVKVPEGQLTSRLQYIKPGDEILVNTKSVGTLVMANLKPGRNLYLLATGTGVAPFMSLVRGLETYENFNNVTFYYNKGIIYNYNAKNKIFEINQKNLSGRSFFFRGKINGVKIVYKGKFEYFNNKIEKRIDLNNLTGCLSFIKTSFIKTSISSFNATCEDGINIIKSSGELKQITSNNSLYDAVDVDFSKLLIKEVEVKNALNDCLDFSFGDYDVSNSKLNLCGDKAISVGEKSHANFNYIELQNAKIGVASKDSSSVYIENSKISKVENCFASYRKKQEFDGGLIKVKFSNCETFSKNLYFDKDSKIEIIKNENT